MLNAGKMNERLFIKVAEYLPFSFRKKNLNKVRYNIYGNLLQVFNYKHRRFPSWGEIKPPTPALQPIQFQLQRKSY